MICVFRIGQLGDTLACLPAVLALKKIHPGEAFTLITNKPGDGVRVTAWNIFRHTGCFGKVLFYEPGSFFSLAALLLKIILSGKRKILYYLPPFRSGRQVLRDKIFFHFLCGFKEIRGLEASRNELVARDGAGRLRTLEKESDRLLKVVCPEGCGRPEPPLLLPGDGEREKIDLLLKDIPSGRRLVALGHGSKMKSKIWPPDRFNALCQRLLAHDPRFYFLLLGDKSEYLHGEPIRKGLEIASLNLSGKTSIIESATALQRCAAYIGNDTGTMHLAAAMGVPVVAIFSAIDSPGKWEPYGDKNTVIRKNVECEGCMLTTCVDQKMMCLNLISVDEVYEASLARLQSTYYPGMEEARGPKAEAY